MKVLMVLTSHDQLGDTGVKTGFWLEEFASPYYRLKDAGAAITLASPEGGQPPLEPKSLAPDAQNEDTQRYEDDPEVKQAMANTLKLTEVKAEDFDAVFYPGGHGPMWDLYEDKDSIALIENFISAEKPVAAVCHGPAVLLQAKGPDGEPLVKGRKVTGFSNAEEELVELTDVVPYLLEDELVAKGGLYQKTDNWEPLAVTDGLLITGQNPASSAATADALVAALGK